MDMNLRKDGYFVQDSAWYEAERRFGDFVSRSLAESISDILNVSVSHPYPAQEQ